jgi:ABC-type lipoprotein release transport system permease subunit
MNTLAWWLIRAQFRTRRAATTLSMLAIALGVALGYSIHLINAAALADFSRAMKTVQGDPEAVIAARDSAGSVPLASLNEIARDPAVVVIAPVIETRVRIDNLRSAVRLIGLDVFSAAAVMPRLLPRQAAGAATGSILEGGVYASPALLGTLALQAGSALTLRRGDQQWSTTIAGDLPAAGADELLLVADIAWVQEHFGPPDAVSEGRVRLAPDTDPASWRAALAQRLPAGLLLRAADDDAARVSNLSRAYRVNLNVLALVALLTGAFLVFATQLTAVAQRSTQFAVLGVLGLSPRMRWLQILGEGLAIGLPGSVLGLGLGYALALAFTRLLGGDLGGGYFSASAPLIVPETAACPGLPGARLRRQPGGCFLPGAPEPPTATGRGPEDRLQPAHRRRRQALTRLLLPALLILSRDRAGATAALLRAAAGRLRGHRRAAGARRDGCAAADAGDLRLVCRAIAAGAPTDCPAECRAGTADGAGRRQRADRQLRADRQHGDHGLQLPRRRQPLARRSIAGTALSAQQDRAPAAGAADRPGAARHAVRPGRTNGACRADARPAATRRRPAGTRT